MGGSAPLMWLAGLWDTWTDAGGTETHSFTILTGIVHRDLAWLHDRMPIFLESEESMERWLASREIQDVRPFGGLVWHPVSPAFGKATYDHPPKKLEQVMPCWGGLEGCAQRPASQEPAHHRLSTATPDYRLLQEGRPEEGPWRGRDRRPGGWVDDRQQREGATDVQSLTSGLPAGGIIIITLAPVACRVI